MVHSLYDASSTHKSLTLNSLVLGYVGGGGGTGDDGDHANVDRPANYSGATSDGGDKTNSPGQTREIGGVDKEIDQSRGGGEIKKTSAPAVPPSVDFQLDQFSDLMGQIDAGDADQKAYAAMELQTMALDSKSQVSENRYLA